MYLHPYNKLWPEHFINEKGLILAASTFEMKIHHIGSTAVPGMYAKNCIDMLGVVKRIDIIESMITPLSKIGYECKGAYGIEGRVYFSKPHGPKCHFHVFQTGDENIVKHLSYVKTMTENPRLIDELNQVKIKLHNIYPNNKDRYQQEKKYFYDKIEKIYFDNC